MAAGVQTDLHALPHARVGDSERVGHVRHGRNPLVVAEVGRHPSRAIRYVGRDTSPAFEKKDDAASPFPCHDADAIRPVDRSIANLVYVGIPSIDAPLTALEKIV